MRLFPPLLLLLLLLLLFVLPSTSLRRPMFIKIEPSFVSLETSITRFVSSSEQQQQQEKKQQDVVVDLYSLVHVGDASYYEAIAARMLEYDVVLFELITSKSNVYVDETGFRRSLMREIYSKGAEDLAARFGLATQLMLPLHNKNWFVADLDAETVLALEGARKAETSAMYWKSLFAGRSSGTPFMSKFFLSDAPLLTGLRTLCWLLPCPELPCLLLDWSRAKVKGGGLPAVLTPITQALLAGELTKAKQMSFAQQLLAGLPDDGGWGGEARSDVEVRVRARNAECIRILQGLIRNNNNNNNNNNNTTKVAVLYGAYHIGDLSARMTQSLGLRIANSSAPAGAGVFPSPEHLSAWTIPLSVSSPSAKSSLALVCGALIYLSLGTLDWFVLVKIFITELLQKHVAVQGLLLDQEVLTDTTFGIGYACFYLLRHLQLLRAVSGTLINWDRGLFDDV